jgi:hypothetical protein
MMFSYGSAAQIALFSNGGSVRQRNPEGRGLTFSTRPL